MYRTSSARGQRCLSPSFSVASSSAASEKFGLFSEQPASARGRYNVTPVQCKVDETGTATGAGVTWTCNNTWNLPTPDQPGGSRMMGGYLDMGSNTTTTVTVTGIAAKTYDLYVYADGDNGGASRSAHYALS